MSRAIHRAFLVGVLAALVLTGFSAALSPQASARAMVTIHTAPASEPGASRPTPAPPIAGNDRSSTSDPSTTPAGCHSLHPSEVLPARLGERSAALACAVRASVVAASASVASPQWARLAATPPPFQLYNFQVTYDAHDGYLFLFGDAVTVSGGPAGGSESWSFHAGS